MYSQCPECQTRFRVTAAALRAAHGTVRCGRCGSAFDALQSLSDSLQDDANPASRDSAPLATFIGSSDDVASNDSLARDGVREDAVVTEFHFSPDDIEQVFVDARDWQRQFGLGGETSPNLQDLGARAGAQPAAGTVRSEDGPDEDVFVHEPEAVEDITLEGERIVIESLPELDDDLREIGAGDELHDGREDAVRLDDHPAESASVDLDPTDRYEILRAVPESKYPELPEDEAEPPASHRPDANEDSATDVATDTSTSEGAEPSPYGVDAQDSRDDDRGRREAAEAAPTVAPEAAQETVPETAPAVAADRPLSEHEADRLVAAAPATASQAAPESAPDSAPAPAPIVPFRLRDRTSTFDESVDEDTAEEDGRRALLWSAGALVLAVALLSQLTHYYRHELARDARLGPVVRSLYAGLGQPLAPNWDLAAFELRQWGASEPAAAEPGTMTVRASLRNGADFAQPMPLLRVELEDRFGNAVARRDFQPGEYLKDPAQATRLLAPGAKTEAELALVDVNAEAVGYRLDICLRDETQGVRCAQPAAPDASPQ